MEKKPKLTKTRKDTNAQLDKPADNERTHVCWRVGPPCKNACAVKGFINCGFVISSPLPARFRPGLLSCAVCVTVWPLCPWLYMWCCISGICCFQQKLRSRCLVLKASSHVQHVWVCVGVCVVYSCWCVRCWVTLPVPFCQDVSAPPLPSSFYPSSPLSSISFSHLSALTDLGRLGLFWILVKVFFFSLG